MSDQSEYMPDPQAEQQRVPTGIAGLDSLIGGGFLRGGLYIIVGTLGAGKTVFVHQIAFNHLADNGRVLYLTVLSETHTRLLGHIRRFSFFRPDVIGLSLSYISGYRILREQGARALLQIIQPMIREHKISLLIVDGLPLIAPHQPYDIATDEFLHDLQAYSEITQCTTLVATPAYPHVWESHAFLFVDGAIELAVMGSGQLPYRTLEIKKFLATAHYHGPHMFQIGDEGVVFPEENGQE